METSCKTCIHEEVCSLWRREECQDASCFQLDGCDYYKEAAARWIPVTERLPKSAERYFVMRFDYVAKAPFYDLLWFENGRWWNRHFEGDYAVTHWMPLPEPPKEGENV